MGISCSRDRMRCLMTAEAFISVILFAASMYMFFMVGYFTSNSRKILSLIFAVLGGLILVGGVITTSYAVAIWRDLRIEDDAQKTESPERKVRFSSLLEIHEDTQEKQDRKENDYFDHEYEEISPSTLGKEQLASDKHLKAKFDYEQENSEVYPRLQLFHLPSEDEESLHNKNLLREACKAYLEQTNSYGTFKGSYENYHERDIKELKEHEDEEEIII